MEHRRRQFDTGRRPARGTPPAIDQEGRSVEPSNLSRTLSERSTRSHQGRSRRRRRDPALAHLPPRRSTGRGRADGLRSDGFSSGAAPTSQPRSAELSAGPNFNADPGRSGRAADDRIERSGADSGRRPCARRTTAAAARGRCGIEAAAAAVHRRDDLAASARSRAVAQTRSCPPHSPSGRSALQHRRGRSNNAAGALPCERCIARGAEVRARGRLRRNQRGAPARCRHDRRGAADHSAGGDRPSRCEYRGGILLDTGSGGLPSRAFAAPPQGPPFRAAEEWRHAPSRSRSFASDRDRRAQADGRPGAPAAIRHASARNARGAL